MIFNNILQTIGRTPLIKINRLIRKKNVNVYAKIEGVNPGGSIKDRIALKMIEEAEKNGLLNKSKTIIEATSGNTGIALAMIGAVKQYSVEIVMSEAVSIERRKMIQAFGAKVTLTNAKKGTDGAILKVKELLKKYPHRYYCTDQFSNKNNKIAHYETTAQEIWEATEGNLNYFISAIGTSGTLMGVSAFLKQYNPKIQIVSAEPEKGHYIQGLKNMQEAIVPDLYDTKKIDRIIQVNTEKSFAMARKIIQKEGIFVGMSSGAVMLATQKIVQEIDTGNIVVIFPDRGEKYLSTQLFL